MMPGIGRFGPKSSDAATVELQPPLNKIVKSGICKLRVSQYYFDEPLFDEYELTTVRATWDFAAAESIVRDGVSIADLGCGDGRLLLHLAEKYRLKNSVGIDISPVAIERLRSKIPEADRNHLTAIRGDIFDIPPEITGHRFDVVTFGDATINFILEEAKLELLLSAAKNLFRDANSRMLVAVFGDGTPEKLAFMDKRCTVVPFRQKNGRAALIWWAYKYDPERLIMYRSAFAHTDWSESGEIEGVISDLRDRMWTPSSIIPIAARCGLSVDKVVKSLVQDGTAVGMDTAIIIFKSA